MIPWWQRNREQVGKCMMGRMKQKRYGHGQHLGAESIKVTGNRAYDRSYVNAHILLAARPIFCYVNIAVHYFVFVLDRAYKMITTPVIGVVLGLRVDVSSIFATRIGFG